MLQGELYKADDPELLASSMRARLLYREYNLTAESEQDKRTRIIKELLGHMGKKNVIVPPFYCDYGEHISTGDHVFMNMNCCILDVAPVKIGDHVMLGPGVQIYTATHPLDYKKRRSGLELGKAITIGDDVWIGGGAIICPGVSVGSRSVVAAGSVVVKDVQEGVVVGGNPAGVIRSI